MIPGSSVIKIMVHTLRLETAHCKDATVKLVASLFNLIRIISFVTYSFASALINALVLVDKDGVAVFILVCSSDDHRGLERLLLQRVAVPGSNPFQMTVCSTGKREVGRAGLTALPIATSRTGI